MDADHPITADDNGDVVDVNGLISETTIKEEDDNQEIVIEEVAEEIKSFLESTDSLLDEPKSTDGPDEYVSEVNQEEQSLDVALVALPDREYSAVASSDFEPEAVLPPPLPKEEEEEEVEASSVKVELEEEKLIEAELPVSSDRAVGDSQYEENVESVQYSGGNENAGEDQPKGVVTSNQIVHHSSWKDCCGLFDVLRR